MLVQHTVPSICVCELNKASLNKVCFHNKVVTLECSEFSPPLGAPSKRVKWKTELTHPTVMLPPLHLYCLISVIPHPLMDQ